MPLKYNITLSLLVDEEANFLDSYTKNHLDNIEEVVTAALYEIDDIKLAYIEVEDDN